MSIYIIPDSHLRVYLGEPSRIIFPVASSYAIKILLCKFRKTLSAVQVKTLNNHGCRCPHGRTASQPDKIENRLRECRTALTVGLRSRYDGPWKVTSQVVRVVGMPIVPTTLDSSGIVSVYDHRETANPNSDRGESAQRHLLNISCFDVTTSYKLVCRVTSRTGVTLRSRYAPTMRASERHAVPSNWHRLARPRARETDIKVKARVPSTRAQLARLRARETERERQSERDEEIAYTPVHVLRFHFA
ncbi:hypothetical protein EVAR_79077_1 [Eumeta japonica]|uniref:Uncharacterized protein n=1 Tax=Eumeta variegata TaxID=151549 RepID=A0A4C1ZQ74_EUMVA|nr:hypothetical protein EVAR_79077_1 [Eumeta japonica]